MNEETLFHLAQEKPAAERAAFLDQACAGDRELQRRVEALVHNHENAGSFMNGPPAGAAEVAEEVGLGLTLGSNTGLPDFAADLAGSFPAGPDASPGPEA